MRVGLFTNTYLPLCGGVTTAVETLREELEALGHQVWVVAPRSRSSVADPARVVRVPSLPALTYPGFELALPWAPGLARRLGELDVFHAQHPFLLGETARRLARRHRRPLIFTYHTHYEKYAHYVPFPRRAVERLAVASSVRFANRADLVLVPSETVRAQLARRGVGVPVEVVPTGVPLDLFSPGDRGAARAALGLAPDEPILLYVGRLDREKSVELLLEAFAAVWETLPRARFILIGEGTRARALRARARMLPGGDRVGFHGVRPRAALPEYYRAADLFWFASETETQGLVLVEALACGLPVVAVAAPGVEEAVSEGESGRLVKADARALSDAAVRLLLDPQERRRMGRRGREVVRDAFDARRHAERVSAIYAGLLAGRER